MLIGQTCIGFLRIRVLVVSLEGVTLRPLFASSYRFLKMKSEKMYKKNPTSPPGPVTEIICTFPPLGLQLKLTIFKIDFLTTNITVWAFYLVACSYSKDICAILNFLPVEVLNGRLAHLSLPVCQTLLLHISCAPQHSILVQSLGCLCWYSTFTKTSLLPIYFTLLLCTILHLTDIWGGSSQCTALHIRYCNITKCNAIMQGLTSEEATWQYNTKDSPLRRPRAWPCHPEFQPLHVFPLSSYFFSSYSTHHCHHHFEQHIPDVHLGESKNKSELLKGAGFAKLFS